MSAQFWLVVEMVAIFAGLPLAYRFSPWRIPALPVLWVVAGYAWWRLWSDPGFDRGRLWNWAPLGGRLATMLPVFAAVAALIWLAVRLWAREREWILVRTRPRLWALVMALYPLLSVYPQGVLYRTFFFHRYASFFPSSEAGRWMLILASAAAFGFLHIIFRNWIAVTLTFLGGILFARTYAETGSLATSCMEHALYGCWLFTVGLGEYFYRGMWRTGGDGPFLNRPGR